MTDQKNPTGASAVADEIREILENFDILHPEDAVAIRNLLDDDDARDGATREDVLELLDDEEVDRISKEVIGEIEPLDLVALYRETAAKVEAARKKAQRGRYRNDRFEYAMLCRVEGDYWAGVASRATDDDAELLELLAGDAIKKVQLAVARNENTPTPVLAGLVAKHAKDAATERRYSMYGSAQIFDRDDEVFYGDIVRAAEANLQSRAGGRTPST